MTADHWIARLAPRSSERVEAGALWLLEASGRAREARLGGDGEPQIIVPAGAWYGTRVIDGGEALK